MYIPCEPFSSQFDSLPRNIIIILLATCSKKIYIYYFARQATIVFTTGSSEEAAFKALYEAACKLEPALAAAKSAEIEQQANDLFTRIYGNELTIPQVIEILKRYRKSKDASEKDVYKCMVKNLFDEYQFKRIEKYNEPNLKLTGVLFGTLIQHKVGVFYVPLHFFSASIAHDLTAVPPYHII